MHCVLVGPQRLTTTTPTLVGCTPTERTKKKKKEATPTSNSGVLNGSLVGTCTRCTHVFVHVFVPICMLSRCLQTKFQHRGSRGSLSRARCCWLGTYVYVHGLAGEVVPGLASPASAATDVADGALNGEGGGERERNKSRCSRAVLPGRFGQKVPASTKMLKLLTRSPFASLAASKHPGWPGRQCQCQKLPARGEEEGEKAELPINIFRRGLVRGTYILAYKHLICNASCLFFFP